MHNPPADVRLHVTDHDIATARDALAWASAVGAPAERLEELAADHARLIRARAAQLTEACRATIPGTAAGRIGAPAASTGTAPPTADPGHGRRVAA